VDQLQSVIPGLDPGIHGFSLVDGGVKPGHDELKAVLPVTYRAMRPDAALGGAFCN
jgi:hypothetical protein